MLILSCSPVSSIRRRWYHGDMLLYNLHLQIELHCVCFADIMLTSYFTCYWIFFSVHFIWYFVYLIWILFGVMALWYELDYKRAYIGVYLTFALPFRIRFTSCSFSHSKHMTVSLSSFANLRLYRDINARGAYLFTRYTTGSCSSVTVVIVAAVVVIAVGIHYVFFPPFVFHAHTHTDRYTSTHVRRHSRCCTRICNPTRRISKWRTFRFIAVYAIFAGLSSFH